MQAYLKTLNLLNACQIYFVECVSKVKHIISVIHYALYGAAWFQFTHFPCDDWENIYTLSYYHHHQVGSTICYPLLRVRSWNNGMRCMSIYVLMDVINYPWSVLRCGYCCKRQTKLTIDVGLRHNVNSYLSELEFYKFQKIHSHSRLK